MTRDKSYADRVIHAKALRTTLKHYRADLEKYSSRLAAIKGSGRAGNDEAEEEARLERMLKMLERLIPMHERLIELNAEIIALDSEGIGSAREREFDPN